VELHVHEAGGGAEDGDGGDTGDGCGIQLSVAEDAKRAGAFGDQDVAGGQEFDGAGRGEPARYDGCGDVALFPGLKGEGSVFKFGSYLAMSVIVSARAARCA
jgi:hypothetical protein